MTSVTTRETVVSPPGKEKERENLSVASEGEGEGETGREGGFGETARARIHRLARVTLADGSTATGALPLGASPRRRASSAHIAAKKKNDEPFEIWNTWPRERVDSGEEADAHERARTLESLAVARTSVRPSLLVVRPRDGGDARRKTSPPRKKNASARGGGAFGAGGALAALLDLLRRVWATLAMFLGIGLVEPSPGSGGGGGGTARAETAFGTQDAAGAAHARRRGVFQADSPRFDPRGGGGGGGGRRARERAHARLEQGRGRSF